MQNNMLSEILHICVYSLAGELAIHTILLTLCAIVIFKHFVSKKSVQINSFYGVMTVTLYTMQSLLSLFITENNSLYTTLYVIVFLCIIVAFISLLLFVRYSRLGPAAHLTLIMFIIFSVSSFMINVLPHYMNKETLNGLHRLPGLLAALSLFVLIHQDYLTSLGMRYENKLK